MQCVLNKTYIKNHTQLRATFNTTTFLIQDRFHNDILNTVQQISMCKQPPRVRACMPIRLCDSYSKQIDHFRATRIKVQSLIW